MDTKMTLKAARVNAGLTLKDASKELGVGLQTLVSWETGKTSPTLRKTKRICEVYQIQIQDIFLQ